MPVLRLTHAFLGALLALTAVTLHAGEPKQIYYGSQLPSGQTIYSTDCAETVLAGLHESCPTAFMAEGFPVITPPEPGSPRRAEKR